MQSMLEGSSSHKKDAGQITGTNSDLRKLSMKESQRILRDYGVTESEIKGVHSILMTYQTDVFQSKMSKDCLLRIW